MHARRLHKAVRMCREAHERQSVVLLEVQEASGGHQADELVALAKIPHYQLEALPGLQGQ